MHHLQMPLIALLGVIPNAPVQSIVACLERLPMTCLVPPCPAMARHLPRMARSGLNVQHLVQKVRKADELRMQQRKAAEEEALRSIAQLGGGGAAAAETGEAVVAGASRPSGPLSEADKAAAQRLKDKDAHRVQQVRADQAPTG
jgi:hypothetical protein